jgi:transcriptional regulator with XRE-family HTH domain
LDFSPHIVALGAIVAAERKRQGLTQEQLADRAGIHVVLLSRVERGKTDARISTLMKIADGLGVEASVLLASAPAR